MRNILSMTVALTAAGIAVAVVGGLLWWLLAFERPSLLPENPPPSNSLVDSVANANNLESLRAACTPLAAFRDQTIESTRVLVTAMRQAWWLFTLTLVCAGAIFAIAFGGIHVYLKRLRAANPSIFE